MVWAFTDTTRNWMTRIKETLVTPMAHCKNLLEEETFWVVCYVRQDNVNSKVAAM